MPKSNTDCIFCKIVAGEIPSFKIYEDDKYLAFLDISQFTEGHALVIPKNHYENIWAVPDVAEYFEVVQKVGQNFLQKGFKLVDTATFGTLVRHSHVHVIPHNGDNVDWEKATKVIGQYQRDSRRHPSKEEGERIAKKYRF